MALQEPVDLSCQRNTFLPSFVHCSDLQNICLTGKTTETDSDRKTTASSNTKKPSNQGLPFIITSSYSKQISANVEKKNSLDEGREEKTNPGENPRDLIRTAPELTQDTVLPSVPSKPDAPHQTQDKPVSISAKSRSKNETKRFQKDRIRLPKFQCTESRVFSSKKISKENSNVTDKMERRETKAENISNSDSDERANRQLISRGNLHLGSTVQSPKLNSRLHSRVTVGKCEVFSSTAPNTVERVREPYQTRTKLPSETSFIRILGHQTGPPPKATSQNRSKEENKERPKTEEKACPNHNLPLQYLTKFDRRNFHHVLEARSFKPGERKLRATALADFHS